MKGKQKKERSEVGFVHSIKGKIVLLVVVCMIIAVSFIMIAMLPSFSKNLIGTTENYMYDMAATYGKEVTELYKEKGEDALKAERLVLAIGSVTIKGVNTSYAYVTDGTGKIIYHRNASLMGTQSQNPLVLDLADQISGGTRPMTEAVNYTDQEGVAKCASYYVDPSKAFILIIEADESDILGSVSTITVRGIVVGIITMLFCCILGYIEAGVVARPIKNVTKIVEKIGRLDLTEDEKLTKLTRRKDETGKMSQAIQGMQVALIGIVSELQNQSNQLFAAAAILTKNSNETTNAVEQVELAIQDIAEGSTAQATDTETASRNVVLIGEMVEKTSQSANALDGRMKQMQAAGNDADGTLKELNQINEQAKSAIDIIFEQTKNTNQSAARIKEAIALITEIAEETNLLSLNATIEAARAGEQGRGFAVVAAQIQKLADQSNHSAMQVEEIANSLIQDSIKAVETMDEVKEIMDAQVAKVRSTDEIFGEVQNGMALSMDGIESINEQISQLDAARVKVIDVVQNLTAIAEENAASTEQTSASVTEVSAIMSDISANAKQLEEVANRLDANMDKFRLE